VVVDGGWMWWWRGWEEREKNDAQYCFLFRALAQFVAPHFSFGPHRPLALSLFASPCRRADQQRLTSSFFRLSELGITIRAPPPRALRLHTRAHLVLQPNGLANSPCPRWSRGWAFSFFPFRGCAPKRGPTPRYPRHPPPRGEGRENGPRAGVGDAAGRQVPSRVPRDAGQGGLFHGTCDSARPDGLGEKKNEERVRVRSRPLTTPTHPTAQMCNTPELCAEATLQPLRRFPALDAVVIFSDILIVPQAMGMEVHMNPGPSFPSPLKKPADVARLTLRPDADACFAKLYEGIALTRKLAATQVGKAVPVIGFCGAPWTLMGYMIDGQTYPPPQQTEAQKKAAAEAAAAEAALTGVPVLPPNPAAEKEKDKAKIWLYQVRRFSCLFSFRFFRSPGALFLLTRAPPLFAIFFVLFCFLLAHYRSILLNPMLCLRP
jgi:hypothetical protein